MNKYIFLFYLLVMTMVSWSEDYNAFYFAPPQELVNDYFSFKAYLDACETNEAQLEYDWIDKYYNQFVNQESFHSLLFESFLLQTKNIEIRNNILKYIEVNELNNDFTNTLIRKYNSKELVVPFEDRSRLQNIYNDEFIDENINLFKLYEISCFDNKLGLIIPDNDWTTLTFSNPDKDDNKETLIFMFGGGTNHLSLNIEQYSDIDFKEFYENEINNDFNKTRYSDWNVKEIEPLNILSNAGADKIFISTGTGGDPAINEIKNGTSTIFLYNDKLKTGYSVSYFMNFSYINNNYELRFRIWNQLLMLLNFVYIIQ